MNSLFWLIMGACIGTIITGVIADRVNKAQTKKFEERIQAERKNNDKLVNALQSDIQLLKEKCKYLRQQNVPWICKAKGTE